jgi:Domain of unknown function (DUF4936)
VSRSLFVYWKVDAAAAPAAIARAHAAQAGLRAQWPALEARLWRRDDAAPQVTVMETYAAAGGIEAADQARIEAAMAPALAGVGAGTRHVEAFRPA